MNKVSEVKDMGQEGHRGSFGDPLGVKDGAVPQDPSGGSGGGGGLILSRADPAGDKGQAERAAEERDREGRTEGGVGR